MMKVIEDDRVLIQAFENATPATIVHEVSHLLRRNLPMRDQEIVRSWLVSEAKRFRGDEGLIPKDLVGSYGDGSVVTKDGEFTRFGEELFARGFETYLATGKAPKGASQALIDAFAKLKEWVVAAYKNISAREGVQLSDDIRNLFDRYLLGDEVKVEQNPNWKKRRVDTGLSEEAHFAEVSAALKRGENVPLEVLLDYPKGRIAEIQRLMKRDLKSIDQPLVISPIPAARAPAFPDATVAAPLES